MSSVGLIVGKPMSPAFTLAHWPPLWRKEVAGAPLPCVPPPKEIRVCGRLRDRDKLRYGAERRVQVVELIGEPTGSGGQAGETVERTINSAVIGEKHERGAIRKKKVHRVLIGVNLRDVAASVHVSEIDESICAGAIARGRTWIDRALIEVGCSGVQIGRRSVGEGRQREIVVTLRRSAAAEEISAVGDS